MARGGKEAGGDRMAIEGEGRIRGGTRRGERGVGQGGKGTKRWIVPTSECRSFSDHLSGQSQTRRASQQKQK